MTSRSLQETSAIPAGALLLRDFVNTVEWQEDSDSWSTPDELAGWLSARLELTVGGLDEADLLAARRLREGLRAVFLQHAGHDPLASELDHLNHALAEVPMRMRISEDGTLALVPCRESALGEPLARIIAALDASRMDGSFQRLKACSRESCRWAYWDGSRNQSGRWCSMAWCGNYVKMRRRNGNPLEQGELLPEHGQRRVATLVDVAARAGVSVKTASNVVTGSVHVAPATRARVETAIAELDYEPNLAARALRSSAPRGPSASAGRRSRQLAGYDG